MRLSIGWNLSVWQLFLEWKKISHSFYIPYGMVYSPRVNTAGLEVLEKYYDNSQAFQLA